MNLEEPPIRQAADFFARLASAGSIGQLNPEQRRSFAEELRRILQPIVPADRLPSLDAKATWRYSLQIARELARQRILDLLAGQPAVVNRDYLPRVVFRLQGRRVQEAVDKPTTVDGLYSVFLAVLRHDPFLFGQCAVCGTVFVLPKKGKPKRYCSASCKAKGVPSAAKRTEYARAQRHKRRRAEIRTTRRILRAWPREEQWEMLQKAFPRKSRRQLLFLLRQAKQEPQRKRKEA